MKALLFLILLFLFGPTVTMAQSSRSGRNQAQKEKIDDASLCVTYILTRAVDTISNRTYKDLRMLEIGTNVKRDYSIYADKSDSIAFETYKKDPEAGADLYGWLKPGERGFCEDYYSDYPQKGQFLNSLFIVNTEYRYVESAPVFNWQFYYGEIQTILGYTCHKAIAKFRGRTWTVWFTTEIPVTQGPWKFNGLPGLILSASDANHYFEFRVVGIEKGQSSPIYMYGYNSKNATKYIQNKMKIITANRNKIEMLQTLFWKDPVYLNELHGVTSAVRTKSGKTVLQKSGDIQRPYIPPLELE